MDLGRILKEGWELFLKDIIVLFVMAILYMVLTAVTLGILGGPMLAGTIDAVLRRTRDGRAIQVGDLFARFDQFGRYLGAFYVLTILIGIGFCLLVVPGIYLATIWFYTFPLLVDRPLSLGDAMRESYQLVHDGDFWTHTGLVILLTVLSAVLSGVLLGAPIAFAYTLTAMTAAYVTSHARRNPAPAPINVSATP